MGFEAITYEVIDEIGVLTINRPKQRNALDLDMRMEIQEVLLQIRQDVDIRALVLTGAGGYFCAGGDVKSVQQMPKESTIRRERVRKTHIWFEELANLEVPVIGAVDGVAFGAGFSLTLACDFVFCTPKARFCAVFMRSGLIPDLGCLYLLPRLVGLQKAREILYTAKIIKPEEAKELGLAYEIVEDEPVLDKAMAFARRFLDAPPAALGITKTILNQSLHTDHKTISELESFGQAVCIDTPYYREAISRFIDKKPALYNWEKYTD